MGSLIRQFGPVGRIRQERVDAGLVSRRPHARLLSAAGAVDSRTADGADQQRICRVPHLRHSDIADPRQQCLHNWRALGAQSLAGTSRRHPRRRSALHAADDLLGRQPLARGSDPVSAMDRLADREIAHRQTHARCLHHLKLPVGARLDGTRHAGGDVRGRAGRLHHHQAARRCVHPPAARHTRPPDHPCRAAAGCLVPDPCLRTSRTGERPQPASG